MDNVPIEKENSPRMDFSKALESFVEKLPPDGYRLVESAEYNAGGRCNGYLNEYETGVLRKALVSIEAQKDFDIMEPLDISARFGKINKMNLLGTDGEVKSYRAINLTLGSYVIQHNLEEIEKIKGKNSPQIEYVFLTMMKLIEYRIDNTTTIEIALN